MWLIFKALPPPVESQGGEEMETYHYSHSIVEGGLEEMS